MSGPAQDPELWVTSDYCPDRDWLIEGNAHTHPGRLAIWCPHRGGGYNLSRDEIRETSVAGRYWIRGFVVGNEPNSPLDDDGFPIDETSADYQAWESARLEYLRQGVWPVDAPRRF